MFSLRTNSLIFAFLLATACSRSARHYLDQCTRAAAAGKDNEAILNFEKALRKNSQSGQAYLQLGLVFKRESNLRKAYSALAQAVELLPDSDPDSNNARVALADVALTIYLADNTRPLAMYDQINSVATKLLAENPQSFDGLRLKGDLALLNEHGDQARDWLQKANQVKPMQSNVILPLVESLFGNNQPEEAEKLALQLIAVEKTNSAAYDALYLFYATHNQNADAEKILQLKVENNPGDARPRLQLAEHYAHLANNQQARWRR